MNVDLGDNKVPKIFFALNNIVFNWSMHRKFLIIQLKFK